MSYDLAILLARTIEQIFADVPDAEERRSHLVEFLRDEIFALEGRQARCESAAKPEFQIFPAGRPRALGRDINLAREK